MGCQGAISREVRDQVDESMTFEQLLFDPERYRGRIILLGGEIIRARNTNEEGILEVLQRPLARDERPMRNQMSHGRFLVVQEKFLDPVVYKPGLSITVVGEVMEKRLRPLDEIEYGYPVVQAREMVLWGPHRRGPVIRFGFGATFVR